MIGARRFMGFFKKKADPISDRSKALKAEIAALEAQITELSAKARQAPPPPRLRSTAQPHGPGDLPAASLVPLPAPSAPEPVFEAVNQQKIANALEAETTPEHYNDLGVRKYDLSAAWRRFQNHFRGPAAQNPRLINYLAAGSLKGLRPLRYEKRVARNRFIALFVILVLFLLGVLSVFVRNH
jgi:cell division protein FtsB